MEGNNFYSLSKIALFLQQNDNNFEIASPTISISSGHTILDMKYFCNYSTHIESLLYHFSYIQTDFSHVSLTT